MHEQKLRAPGLEAQVYHCVSPLYSQCVANKCILGWTFSGELIVDLLLDIVLVSYCTFSGANRCV